jgi:hypothetical protein
MSPAEVQKSPVLYGGHASPHYREFPPGPLLAGLVECFWTSTVRTAPKSSSFHRVLPDGCMDLLFDFSSVGRFPMPSLNDISPCQNIFVAPNRRYAHFTTNFWEGRAPRASGCPCHSRSSRRSLPGANARRRTGVSRRTREPITRDVAHQRISPD